MTRRSVMMFVPLAVLVLLAALFVARLGKPTEVTVPSRWIDRPVPSFTLPAASADRPGLTHTDLATGHPVLLNIFASWCIPCRAEAPVLDDLARRGVTIHGIAMRDTPEDTRKFLAAYGNPYARIGDDRVSAVPIALGAAGVPETFVIDGKGVVRHQVQGPVTPDMVPDLMRRLDALKAAGQ